ncbi:MAG: 5-methyltetrahydropteroyltriglutamate--homocysteine S-methyltransferase [Eubacteriales bacterium]|nr:5-methyltetrahydropteroyltriglutamate--homocysteine S-methyltransferase [Eubacteriales bacterium]
MSKNSIVGYPRVGSQRELKFFTEDYFKGAISADDLKKNAAALRKSQWLLQKQHGLDFIPSNDFSFYDGVLDAASMLNVVPQVYKTLGFDELDTYFAMARGYQGSAGDVKALSMRKWFNTNYHYMVPVLDGTSEIRLNSDKPFARFTEALSYGIKTKPVLIGPFTFLKLADIHGNIDAFAGDMVKAYKKIFDQFNVLGAEWIQIDEPSLVTDLTKKDIGLFVSIYSDLLTSKGGLKILLQTYFGDIRDVYTNVAGLGFDGIGLDFIEGKKSLELVEANGFLSNVLLFAGVVNGKNVWRNDYEKTLKLLHGLSRHVDHERIVINTSCSLLHVPYTIKNETGMAEYCKNHLAFAEEKLAELSELKALFDDGDYSAHPGYQKNAALMQDKANEADAVIREKVAGLTENDFIRKPAFSEREKLQKKSFGLPVLPTTTIGSFPQTPQVKALRAALKRGEITQEQYQTDIKVKIAECIALQEEIGLDVLVHGEFERNDMVEYFGQNLDGFLFTQKGWVQSYGTRCVKPPIILKDIRRSHPITADYCVYAQSLTKKPVKGMLTGPVTILNWSFPREDILKEEMAFQIALAIKEEVMALEEKGIRIIQIDEAALKEKLPIRRADWHTDYLDWAIAAFRLVHASVKPDTQIHTHMCYSEFEEIIEDINAMDADVISFEASRSNLSIVDALERANFKTQVGPGVYDIHSPRVPGVAEIEAAIHKMLKKINKNKLWVNPDCGLKTRGEEETIPSLKNMVAAAVNAREKLNRI